MFFVRKYISPLLMAMFFVVISGSIVFNAWGAEDKKVLANDTDSTAAQATAHTSASVRASLLYESPVTLNPGVRETSPVVAKKRSIGLAFGMSALVPGLGQAYNKQWGKAIAAAVMEAAVITGIVVWNSEGNDLERQYQLYAHRDWSPTKYANWLNDYSDFISVETASIVIPSQIDFQNPDSWNDQEWQQVLSFFGQIRDVERQMFHLNNGAAFSHTLPDFSEQQYYELIGKYYQFAPGWSDYESWLNEDGSYNDNIEPFLKVNGELENVPGNFFQYADDHAEANRLLRRASRISGLLIVTHLASAIDAAISAKLNNDRITPGIELGTNTNGDLQPKAKLTVKL